MTEKEFEEHVLTLLNEYRHLITSADEDILARLKDEVEYQNNGQWGDGMARKVLQDFKIALSKTKRTQELPSS